MGAGTAVGVPSAPVTRGRLSVISPRILWLGVARCFSVGGRRHASSQSIGGDYVGLMTALRTLHATYTDLKSQLTRASQSIVDNIVEGCGAASRLEFARYLDISIKSTSEVDYQLELARDLGVMSHDVWKPLAKDVVEIRKML